MHRGKKTNECFLPSLARQSPHKAFYWYRTVDLLELNAVLGDLIN